MLSLLLASPGFVDAALLLGLRAAPLQIGQAADLEPKLVFDIDACTKTPHCFAFEQFFDLIFNGGKSCGPKSARLELPFAECTFTAQNGGRTDSFVVTTGVFVAPADGELTCGAPTTPSPELVEHAKDKAKAEGFKCSEEVVPVSSGDGDIKISVRPQ